MYCNAQNRALSNSDHENTNPTFFHLLLRFVDNRFDGPRSSHAASGFEADARKIHQFALAETADQPD